jgi:hypothetical protein
MCPASHPSVLLAPVRLSRSQTVVPVSRVSDCLCVRGEVLWSVYWGREREGGEETDCWFKSKIK